MGKLNLKPRIPDIAGNKKYDDYNPETPLEAKSTDKTLGTKFKVLLVGGVLVCSGVAFFGMQSLSSNNEPVSLPPAPSEQTTVNSPETQPSSAGEQGTTENDTVRYDTDVEQGSVSLTLAGENVPFYGEYDAEANYQKSLDYSRNLAKKYGQDFEFYPIVGQNDKGIDVLSNGAGNGFLVSPDGDNLYGLLYGSANDTQKWFDEYIEDFPEMTYILRSVPERLMSGTFDYDDISVTQRIATPNIIIAVEEPGDYASKVKGFAEYLSDGKGFKGDFTITVQVVKLEAIGEFFNDEGQSSLTYETFYSSVSAGDMGKKYDFKINKTD